MQCRWGWTIGLGLLPALVQGQIAADSQQVLRDSFPGLQEVVIEASLAPRGVSVVPMTELTAQMPQISLAEGLRLVPGVQVEDRRNLSQGDRISLRGVGARAQFGVRSIRIDFDAIPLTFADGQSQVNLLDLAWVSSVQVEHGPAALSYGNSAGGRISYSLQQASPGWQTTLRSSVGTGGLNRQSLWVGYGDDDGRSLQSGWLGISHTSYDGIRPNSGGRFFNVGGGTTLRVGTASSLTLTALTYFAPWLENPGTLNWTEVQANARQTRAVIQQQGAGKTVSQGVLAATLRRETEQPWSLTLHGGWRTTDNSIVGTYIELPRVAGGARYSQQFLYPTDFRVHIATEVDWLEDPRREFTQPIRANAPLPANWRQIGSGERGARTTDQTETVLRGSQSVLATWQPSVSPWRVQAGLRAEGWLYDARDHLRPGGVDYSGTRRIGQVSPGASVRFAPNHAPWVQVSASQGLIAPTTTELSNRPDGAGGFNALRSERIRQVELSTGGRQVLDEWGNLNWQVSAFAARWRDQLVPFTVPGPMEIVYYQNAARSRTLGLEATAQAELAKWLNLHGQLSWLDARFQDFPSGTTNYRGRFVPGVAPLRITLWARVGRADEGWNGTVIWQHTAPTWANDANGWPLGQSSYRTPAQHRLDVRASYGRTTAIGTRRMRWQVWAGVDNATGTRLVTLVPNFAGNRFFEPLPGRQWAAGFVLTAGS